MYVTLVKDELICKTNVNLQDQVNLQAQRSSAPDVFCLHSTSQLPFHSLLQNGRPKLFLYSIFSTWQMGNLRQMLR